MPMPTSVEQLLAWIAAPEASNLEFKEAKSRYDFSELVEYCVALANEGGGQVILGVSDRRPRTIVGSLAFAEPGRTEAGLYEQLRRRIPVEEIHSPAGRVVVVHVPSRLPGSPWQHPDGRYLKRAGDGLVSLGPDELRAIFDEVGPDFSAQVCDGATLDDLDAGAIAAFRTRWATREGDERRLAWTDEQTLANAELTVGGKLTYAALILFGTRAALGRHLDQCELVFEYRANDASGPAADRQEFREGFFLWQDALWEYINRRNDRQSYQDGLFRKELLTFDEVSVREALLNAVSHRDYRSGSSIFVRQYPQRLEIVSPGGFPAGVTVENLLEAQNPRNRRLASALQKCGLIERSGQGMNLMFERAIQQGKALPDFTGTSASEVRLTLRGIVTTPEFVKFLESLGAEHVRSFSTDDFLALDSVRRAVPLVERLKARIPGLVEIGAVEVAGRGRGVKHTLSRRFFAAMGSAGTYTRQKGLDRATKKELLFKHIADSGPVGTQMKELKQVLPSENRGVIQVLLRELRRDGRVHSTGATKGARWVAGPGPGIETEVSAGGN